MAQITQLSTKIDVKWVPSQMNVYVCLMKFTLTFQQELNLTFQQTSFTKSWAEKLAVVTDWIHGDPSQFSVTDGIGWSFTCTGTKSISRKGNLFYRTQTFKFLEPPALWAPGPAGRSRRVRVLSVVPERKRAVVSPIRAPGLSRVSGCGRPGPPEARGRPP